MVFQAAKKEFSEAASRPRTPTNRIIKIYKVSKWR